MGLILAGANATAEAITAALEDRDQALGYAKYSDRKDSGIRYAEIATKAVAAQLLTPVAHRRSAVKRHGRIYLPNVEVRL